jgi:cold shock CspA family protein
MQTQFKLDLHGAEPSEALEPMIEKHVLGLEHLYGRLTACHIGIEAPGHHQRKGGLFHVSIHLTLPDGREVNVGTTPRADKRNSDVLFALDDAFRRARRQLQDRVRKMQGQVKVHEAPPTGIIARFDPNTGFGFIEAADGHEVYFHQNSVVDDRPSQIRHGMRVTFVEEMGEKGPQASTVRTLEKHALR